MCVENSSMSPSIAIKVGTVQLDDRDMQTLLPGRWLNDAIIMAYANLAALESRERMYRNSSRTMLLLDTRFAHKLQHYGTYIQIAGMVEFQQVISIPHIFSTVDVFTGSRIRRCQSQHHLPPASPV
jgi:hypothetical protein